MNIVKVKGLEVRRSRLQTDKNIKGTFYYYINVQINKEDKIQDLYVRANLQNA
jgi:hypothetical protein